MSRTSRCLVALTICLVGVSGAFAPNISRVSAVVDVSTWTGQTLTGDAAKSWQPLTYGNGRFVAIANGPNTPVMTSTDGTTWTVGSAGNSRTWYAVTHGNGLFVAVGAGGMSDEYVMTSPDGLNWTIRGTGVPLRSWYDVTFGNGLFVAVGNQGRVMTSTDGTNWTMRTTPTTYQWNGITYGNGRFVAVAWGRTDAVMTSTDGTNWTMGTTPGGLHSWNAVTYGNGLFVAVASPGTDFTPTPSVPTPAAVMTSPDGITWTKVSSSIPSKGWSKVTHGDGVYVAVAFGGQASSIMTSSNGTNWTSRSYTGNGDWNGVVFGDGLFMTIAAYGSPQIMTSGVFTPPPTTTTTTTTIAATTTTIAAATATTNTTASIGAPSTTVGSGSPSTVNPPSSEIINALSLGNIVVSDDVVAGSSVTVEADGFTPGETVTAGILGASSTAKTATADSRGAVSLKVSIPKSASGRATVYAYGTVSKRGYRQIVDIDSPGTLAATGRESGAPTSDALPATGRHSDDLALWAVAFMVMGLIVLSSRRITS